MFNLAHRERGWLIPNQADFNIKQVSASTTSIIKGKKYKGALVESESGVFFDVIALDFASLYPSIVKIKNISYETVNCKSEKHQECRTNLVPETTHWICTRRKGLFSELIGALRDLRVYYYKPASKQLEDPDDRNFMYALSQSTKVLVNASYGILGMERFQYFYLPAAEAITAWARVYITALRKKVIELGMKPIISDTDSVYLWRIQPGVEKTLSKWAEEELGVELEVDERYKYVVASGLKKNYFGVTPNGKVTVKGLTGKKRHTPPFIRELFHDIVNNTLAKVGNTDELEQAKGEIKEKLRETYRKLHNGEIPLHKMEFHYTLSKPIEDYEGNPQHVKVARLLMDRGVNVGQGSVVGYVKTVDGAIPTRFASPSRIDEKKYVDFMRSTFEQILDTLEISFDDTVYGLTKLTAFM